MTGRLIVIAGLAALLATPAVARDQIRIVGSSTVFPFSSAVAERFGRASGFKTPVVESTGSGGGFKLFCAGVGPAHPDITNASRRIKPSEVRRCKDNGVIEIAEVRFGFDGIVLAAAKSASPLALTREQIYRALAKRVPIDGKLVPNPYRRWSDIAAGLADRKIEVLGPPPTSGTRDAFVELAMEGGARTIPMLAELRKTDKRAFREAAGAIREDGAYVEAGENDNLIVRKLIANPGAVGLFGYSFLDQNADRLQGSRVDGVEPSFENIASGAYPVSRSLYFYVKRAHVGTIPGLEEYVQEFLSETAAGDEGYLADKGLIPLPAAALAQQRAGVKAMALQVP